MTHDALMSSVRWQQARWFVFDREHGRCKICGRPGTHTHHLTYKFGFFDPRGLILLCPPCHHVWQGQDPAHLNLDHPLRPKLFEVAALARSLRGTAEAFGHKVPSDIPEWQRRMFASANHAFVTSVKRLLQTSCRTACPKESVSPQMSRRCHGGVTSAY